MSREAALRARAREIHDARCQWCHRDGYRYVETCQVFRDAIFEAAGLRPAPADGGPS